MRNYTKGLNAAQRKAVTKTSGPLLVLAGAGTGKTRVITHRIAHMLANGVSPRSILAMTFTNKAAGEMKERISALIPTAISPKDLTIGTFHSFCVKALRQYADRVDLSKNFAICDAADQLVAMKQALRELRIAETTLPPKLCLHQVSLFKTRLLEPDACMESDDDHEALLGRVYKRYNQTLRNSNLLDFDDLLLFMVKLLADTRTRTAFRKRYRYLLIDEYQDTNGPQYEIVRQLGEKHRNVCVVGDDDQSIYGWRGADVSKILNFGNDFPEATIVRLETNYRSTNEILNAANAVIRNNPNRHEKALHSHAGSGDPVAIVPLDNEEHEASYVVEDILSRVKERTCSFQDFAILFRTQVQPRIFEMQLRHYQVPYTLVGGMSFFDRKEVRDILAFLRLVENPADELSLLRVINTPPRGIGATTIKKALTIAAETGSSLSDVLGGTHDYPELQASAIAAAEDFFATLNDLRPYRTGSKLVDLVKRLVTNVKYADEIHRCYTDEPTRTARWEAITEIMNMAEIHVGQNRKASLATFLEDLALNAAEDSDDTVEQKDNSVLLSTLHSAKGLEFEQVYLVGAEEGLLPHSRSLQDNAVEEERRLAYVGITRAKRRLTLTLTRSRARYGERVTTIPSRFLYELRGKEPPLDRMTPPTQDKPTPKKKKKATRKRRTRKKR